jgi:hypothetical protein
MEPTPELVRCVSCRHEYPLPEAANVLGCPVCGGISWVSVRFAAADAADENASAPVLLQRP